MKRTDEKILEACSRIYRFESANDIAKAANLKYVTVSQRIGALEKQDFLVSEPYGKGKKYRFNFDFDTARKFRLFKDSLYLYSKTYLKKYLDTLLVKSRKDENIISIIVYGSSLDTGNFNDVDILVISKESIQIGGFDVFNLIPDSFRKLFSLGELRLQAALTNGRIFMDKDFLFSYFNQSLPVPPSDEIVSALNKKLEEEIALLDEEKDLSSAKNRLMEIFELKAKIKFSKKRVQIPSRPNFLRELQNFDPGLYKAVKNLQQIKAKKPFWDFYYKIRDSLTQ